MKTITESTDSAAHTFSVVPGEIYVISLLADDWDGMTLSLKGVGNSKEATIQEFTADGFQRFTAPLDTIKITTGADTGDTGSVDYWIYKEIDTQRDQYRGDAGIVVA